MPKSYPPSFANISLETRIGKYYILHFLLHSFRGSLQVFSIECLRSLHSIRNTRDSSNIKRVVGCELYVNIAGLEIKGWNKHLQLCEPVYKITIFPSKNEKRVSSQEIQNRILQLNLFRMNGRFGRCLQTGEDGAFCPSFLKPTRCALYQKNLVQLLYLNLKGF